MANAACPWNDPETFCNLATAGLPCTCPEPGDYLFDRPPVNSAEIDRRHRDELLPKEDEYLANDRALYLECMHGQLLRERVGYQSIRDGLILFHMIYERLKSDEKEHD